MAIMVLFLFGTLEDRQHAYAICLLIEQQSRVRKSNKVGKVLSGWLGVRKKVWERTKETIF